MKKKILLIAIILFTLLIVISIFMLNKSKRYSELCIDEEKWNSIIKSRQESQTITIEEILFNDYALIVDDTNNTFYYSLINDSKNKYNPSIKFDSNLEEANIAILSDEITDDKAKNNYDFKIMIYNDTSYHIYNLRCTDFPIIDIRNYEETDNDKSKNVEIYLFNNLEDSINRITVSRAKLKETEGIYLFALKKETPGNNMRENRLSIFNLNPHSTYSLRKANENENNLSNTKVELFINGSYQGLYIISGIENKIEKQGN